MTKTAHTVTLIFWMLEIVPPLFLLPLVVMPPNIGTAIFWLIGYLLGLISIISIVAYMVKRIRKASYKSWGLVRPMLTLSILLIASISLATSLQSAKTFAVEKAKEINKQCQSGQCPTSIAGWDKRNDRFNSDTMAGGLAQYRVLYGTSEDRQSFTVVVSINMDDRYIVNGGVGKEIDSSSYIE